MHFDQVIDQYHHSFAFREFMTNTSLFSVISHSRKASVKADNTNHQGDLQNNEHLISNYFPLISQPSDRIMSSLVTNLMDYSAVSRGGLLGVESVATATLTTPVTYTLLRIPPPAQIAFLRRASVTQLGTPLRVPGRQTNSRFCNRIKRSAAGVHF